MAEDPNALLNNIRSHIGRWTFADVKSEEEWEAARDAIWGLQALDAHLKEGGDLPADWDVSPPPVTRPAFEPDTATIIRARELRDEGQKIQAIKEVRAATGMSLKEAKDYVEAL